MAGWPGVELWPTSIGSCNRPKHFVADQTAIRFLGQLARLGVYLFAILTYAHLIPALHGLGTAWLASVGVVSVVFGLAAQNYPREFDCGNLASFISAVQYWRSFASHGADGP